MRIFDPKDQLGNSLLSSADTQKSSVKLEKTMAVGGGAITLTSTDISDIENWELSTARVKVDGQMISFLPDTSRDTDGNLVITLGETFSDVVLVLKRTVFDGMKQEEITIEMKIQQLMEKTLATAGKDGYKVNENIKEWQDLGKEAKATGEEKYRYADVVEWNTSFTVGPIVTEQFLSLQTVPAHAFSEMGIFEWKSDLPCLQNGSSTFSDGPIEVFEGNMPNLVDGSVMFLGCVKLKSFISSLPSLTTAYQMFQGCSELTSWNVALPNSLTDAQCMFLGCSGLTSWTVALPNSLTTAQSMFSGCSELTSWSVALPNSITDASSIFSGCRGLRSWTVALPDSIQKASAMFSGCSGLRSWTVALPNSLTDASAMFSSCTGLTSWTVALPNSITNASWMFSGCSGLTSFSAAMPNSLQDATGMFQSCKLNKASVQNIVENIPIYTSGTHAITIGVDSTSITQAEQDAFSTTLTNKGWTVAWQRN